MTEPHRPAEPTTQAGPDQAIPYTLTPKAEALLEEIEPEAGPEPEAGS